MPKIIQISRSVLPVCVVALRLPLRWIIHTAQWKKRKDLHGKMIYASLVTAETHAKFFQWSITHETETDQKVVLLIYETQLGCPLLIQATTKQNKNWERNWKLLSHWVNRFNLNVLCRNLPTTHTYFRCTTLKFQTSLPLFFIFFIFKLDTWVIKLPTHERRQRERENLPCFNHIP